MQHFNLFVVTPFSEDSKKVWSEALLPAVLRVNELKSYDIKAIRADFELKGLEFSEHLHKHLRECTICLCDITGANPNVMYEIGFARAIGKKTMMIRQSKQEIPVDISDKFVYTYHMDRLANLSQWLETAIVKAIDAVQAKRTSAKPAYEIICFKDRKSADLGAAIDKAEETIAILETNVSTVADTYLPALRTALDQSEDLTVRVLTLDPDSSFVNNRAIQLGVPVGQYRVELHDSIQRLMTELKPYGRRFTLRIYDDFPTQITFLVDDAIYSCSISRGNRSRKLCTFKIHTYDPGAERTFQFHFEAVWAFGEVYVPFGQTASDVNMGN
jgi:hypothetical protein